MNKIFSLKTATVFILLLVMTFSRQSYVSAEDQYTDDLIPTMTSNTTPSGIVSASSYWSNNHLPWASFNDYIAPLGDGWFTAEGQTTGWLAYEFPDIKIISKYTITPRTTNGNTIANKGETPKNWSFEGYNLETNQWDILDTQSNITDWIAGKKKEFTFNNSKGYKQYRINITANNGYNRFVGFGEMEMMEKINTNPNPDPELKPEPKPTGDRAILVVTMLTGLEKEFDLSMAEVNAFISWYENKQAGTGTASYAIDKHDNNKGPFTNRKDYVIFDKILTFEVNEYGTAKK